MESSNTAAYFNSNFNPNAQKTRQSETLSVIPLDHNDQTHTMFFDKNWIPLPDYRVFDYFCLSGFYDKNEAVNEHLRMQRIDPVDPNSLKSIIGVQYVLRTEKEFWNPPNLYVIEKRKRFLEETVNSNVQTYHRLALFYIIDGCIYQAPDVCKVATASLGRAIFCMRDAFSEIQSRVIFSSTGGFEWKKGLKTGQNTGSSDIDDTDSFRRCISSNLSRRLEFESSKRLDIAMSLSASSFGVIEKHPISKKRNIMENPRVLVSKPRQDGEEKQPQQQPQQQQQQQQQSNAKRVKR